MTRAPLFAGLILSAVIAACGGNDTVEVDCDDGSKYQNRVEGKRVVSPEGLDSLNELAEMPIPRADPDAAQPAPGKCVDMPPSSG